MSVRLAPVKASRAHGALPAAVRIILAVLTVAARTLWTLCRWAILALGAILLTVGAALLAAARKR